MNRVHSYELMFVVNPELEEEELDALLERVRGYLENAESQIYRFKKWGLRRLAYPLSGHREGHYYLVLFTVDPQRLADVRRNLRLMEDVLRELVVRIDEDELPDTPEVQPEPEETANEA